MNFSLPPDVDVQSQVLDDGKIYKFRHQTLGLLGRIVLRDSPGGQSHISSEVAGDPNDPMTKARAQIFEPLSRQLCAALEAAVGKDRQVGDSNANIGISPTSPGRGITSKQIPCPRCGELAALLIIANQAREVPELEDCARKMCSIYEDLNVVTWIIGAPVGTLKGDPIAPILRVWPQRHPIRYGTPKMFDAELNAILPRHCGGRLP